MVRFDVVALLSFLYLVLESFLPERWRRQSTDLAALRLAAVSSGLIELALAFIVGVPAFRAYRIRYYEAVSGGGLTEHLVFGATLYIGFLLFSGFGLTALYLGLEGLARTIAGALGDTCGSGPLWLAAELQARAQQRKEALALGPLIPDRVVETPDGRLEIQSCRAREWDELTTLELDGRLFRVVRSTLGEALERRHTYLLEPAPSGWLVRRLIRYSPEDVLAWTPPRHVRSDGALVKYQGGR